MPRPLQAWYSFPELAGLGDRDAVLTGQLELPQLTRLAPLLHADAGEDVAVRLRMSRTTRGQLAMNLSFDVRLNLICQRCLDPMDFTVAEDVAWVVLESDAELATVSGELEALILGAEKGERLQPAELVEDELIVSLPMVPRHASIDECGALAQNLKSVLTTTESEPVDPALEVQ